MKLTPSPTDAPISSTALPDVLQFMRLLWAVVHELERSSKRMAEAFGVTGPQRLVLRVVGLQPGMSAGELAAVLHVHPSTLTGVLQRLVTQRLLVRADHPGDRRRAVLRLTARGRAVNRLRTKTVESAVAAALRGLSHDERDATARALGRIAVSLRAGGRATATSGERHPAGRRR